MTDISLEIANRLAAYTEDVKEGLEQSVDEVTKEAIEKLKATSPKHKRNMLRAGQGRKRHKAISFIIRGTI